MPNCSVPQCVNVGGHRFPRDEELRKKWVVAIKRLQPNSTKLWTPGPASRVCSEHFQPSDYVETLEGKHKSLKPGSIPSVFSFRKKIVLDTAREQRRAKRLNNKHFVHVAIESPAADMNIQNEVTISAPSLESSPSAGSNSESSILKSIDTQCQNHLQSPQKISFLTELKEDPAAMHYYTGFSHYKHFDMFFKALGEAAFHLNYTCHSLLPREQLLLTLTKLRQAKDDFELSRFFHISETTVRQVFSTWINFMYYQLKELDIWPDQKTVQEHMPEDFKKKFPNTRVILNATEFPIQKPTNLIAQSTTFSSYKNHNTLKTVVGCTPSGVVSFISDTYGGRATDRQIVERSSLLTDEAKFSAGDAIMADRGIMVQDLFASRNVQVNTPHLLSGRSQLNAQEVIQDRRVASKRIHIERIIGLAKKFKILKSELHPSKILIGNKIVFICFMICNFRNCIIDKYA